MTARARKAPAFGGGDVPVDAPVSARDSGIFRRASGPSVGPAHQAPERHPRGAGQAGRGLRATLAKGEPFVDRYAQGAPEVEDDLLKVAACSVCLSPTGWVLVEGESIRFANFAFHRIETRDGAQAISAAWQEMAPPRGTTSSRTYPHLSALAIGEAKRMGERRLRLGPTRFKRGSCVVEVTIERPPTRLRSDAEVVLVNDITELARAEGRAAEANAKLSEHAEVRAADEVSVGIAHDLGNTIGAVLARLSVLQRSSTCSASQASELDAIELALSSAAALVNKLQSLAHVRDVRLGPVDPRAIVTSAIEIAGGALRAPSDGRGRVDVRAALPYLPKVTGCADELRNVFVNLLLNARDAMPTGGTVYISGRRDAGQVVFLVEDEGSGIPAADIERIFEPFFSTKGSKGTGMGLAIARATMSRCGGTIVAKRRQVRGACFEMRLNVSN